MENTDMNETTHLDNQQWLCYIETLRQQSQPVKIDILLQKRMQAFISARNAKLLQSQE
jgi:hypothetical protein